MIEAGELLALALVVVMAGALLVILGTTLLNAATFPRLRLAGVGAPPETSAVSILVPARDEVANIAATVEDLLRLDPPPGEVIVLDDGSTDGTPDAARAVAAGLAAAGHPGAALLRVVPGSPLPPGWLGKPWACRQLADLAAGERLLFTDADTRWAPGALGALVAEAERSGAGLLTAWPTQTTRTWGERLTVPLIAFAVLGYLPGLLAHRLQLPLLVAANGQCLLFRRHAYESIGGHAAVRATVLDDVTLARRVAAAGLGVRMVDGAGLVGCRMYRDWPTARDGFGKNILAGYGGVAGLIAATLFHWLVLLGPWVWLGIGGLIPPTAPGAFAPLVGTWPLLPAFLAAAGVAARAVSAAVTRQRIGDALLLPLSALLMTAVAVRALGWRLHGGPRWKGRVASVGRP